MSRRITGRGVGVVALAVVLAFAGCRKDPPTEERAAQAGPLARVPAAVRGLVLSERVELLVRFEPEGWRELAPRLRRVAESSPVRLPRPPG